MSENNKSKEREPMFSPKVLRLLKNPFNLENPITVQVLGICSALAVTVQMKPAIVMALSVTIVTAFSNLIISALRDTIPSRIRIIVQLVVVAALVIIVDQMLKAYVYDVSKKLSVFVGLIITNCILMGRLEAYAMANKPWPSFVDGIGNGLGYGMILVIVAFFRELLGSGKFYGMRVIPQAVYDSGYMDNGLMILPPMALITIGVIIWVQRSRTPDLQEK
jgi:Na+-transporting NADH:ubiquinone oxidoreductase subunit D